MSQTLKVLAALAFVTVLGWVLLQPVFDAVEIDAIDGSDVEETPAPTESSESEPNEEPSAGSSPTEDETANLPAEFRTQGLSDRYPRFCFDATDPGPDPLFAAVDLQHRVRFGTPAGPTQPGPPGGTTLGRVKMIHGFNSSGDLYAAGSRRRAYLAPPEGSQGADGKTRLAGLRSVIWSPRGGCGVAIDGNGSLLVIPDDGAGRLVPEAVASAAFSPDGRKLAVVTTEEEATSVWIASLSNRRLREIAREAPGVRIELEGWSPTSDAIFYRSDRGGLNFVTTDAPPLSGRVSPEPPDELDHPLEQCGGRLLGLIQNRIAEITIRGPEFLTEGGSGHRYISCAPTGNFIAAIGDDGLVLLDGNGNFLRDLTQDSGYTDVFVDWGAPGRGLLFGRVSSDGSPAVAELWYISEGGSPVPTGVTFRAGPHAVDWSGSPPTGLP